MTALDMVDVIAAALTEHEAELDTSGDCYTGYCACNQKVPYVDHAAHQARAVLAAISAAGVVEWGIEIETRHGTARARYKTKAEADSNHPGSMPTSTVSRITGPWTAVG